MKIYKKTKKNRFSMDVTKRCSAEIKQAHKQFAGHMTKIIRKLSYASDSIVACVTGKRGQLCKRTFICMLRRKESCMEGQVPSSRS
jgi:hypothetical protein